MTKAQHIEPMKQDKAYKILTSEWLAQDTKCTLKSNLAFLAISESVFIFHPFITGIAHEATGYKEHPFTIRTLDQITKIRI